MARATPKRAGHSTSTPPVAWRHCRARVPACAAPPICTITTWNNAHLAAACRPHGATRRSCARPQPMGCSAPHRIWCWRAKNGASTLAPSWPSSAATCARARRPMRRWARSACCCWPMTSRCATWRRMHLPRALACRPNRPPRLRQWPSRRTNWAMPGRPGKPRCRCVCASMAIRSARSRRART